MSRQHLLKYVLALCSVFSASWLQAQSAPQAPAPATRKKASVTAQQQHQDNGQRIFEQNCSRCHTAPDGFSSHISETVVMHMRVRASLSQHDAEELLRFFNP